MRGRCALGSPGLLVLASAYAVKGLAAFVQAGGFVAPAASLTDADGVAALLREPGPFASRDDGKDDGLTTKPVIDDRSGFLLETTEDFDDWGKVWHEGSYRQVMTNVQNSYYVANLKVGNQELHAILDTGSFDLVVFSSSCKECGLVAQYTTSSAGKRGEGDLTELSYGSGNVFAVASTDTVEVGPWELAHSSFWEVLYAEMPLLANAEFEAIIGIAPPLRDAAAYGGGVFWARRLKKRLPGSSTSNGHVVPLLVNLGVESFSVCFGKEPGSDGYFVWNDDSHKRQSTMFKQVPVTGTVTWGVDLTNSRLVHPDNKYFAVDLGCGGGCAALIDSGTSLLTVPSFVAARLAQVVMSLDSACSNIDSLPNLVFNLGGSEFVLPPHTYVGKVQNDGDMANYFDIREETDGPKGGCQLMVMESDIVTQDGPMWIFGMPFFRKYYTTFHMGSPHTDRSIFIAPATDKCHPLRTDQASTSVGRPSALFEYDARTMRSPAWLHDRSLLGRKVQI